MVVIGPVGLRRPLAVGLAIAYAACLCPARAYSAPVEQAKLRPPASGPNGELGAGNFGNNAAISSDGNTAIVGAFADHANTGAAWVFTRSGSTWVEQTKLTAPSTGSDKEVGAGVFGSDVALSGDGNTALIGGNGDNGSRGAAWVFTRSGTTWSERKKLVVPSGAAPPSEQGNGELGFSVALSASGGAAFLGAPTDNANGSLGTGAVFAFTGSGASWSQQAELIPNGVSASPGAGTSLATSSDGNTVVAGGPFDAPSGGASGAVWVFTRSGTTWTPTKLVAPDSPSPLAETLAQSELGASAAISADGTIVLAGGPDDGMGNRGAAWIFNRTGASWSVVAKLTPASGTGAGSQFGATAALAANGGTALIGGNTDTSSAGAVWEFTGSGTAWAQRARLTAPAGTETGPGQFGSAVGLSSDAETAVIGGNQDASGLGAAWVFVVPPSISNINPPSGPAGGGTPVVLTGANLGGASAVRFGGVRAASFSVVSTTQIDAVSPPGDPAPVDVTVTTPGGTSTLGTVDRFTYFPSPPGAPSGVHAKPGNGQVTVSFTAPRSNGSGITSYRVVASPGGASARGGGSPITVSGLSNGKRYTFTVTATNGIGPGLASPPSNAAVPEPPPPKLSHVSIKGVGKRSPKLSFKVAAGKHANPLKSVAVSPPKGLSFTRAKAGVRAKGVKFSVAVKHGVLTITFKHPQAKASVTIAAPTLGASKSLSSKARHHKAGKVTLRFKVTDSRHAKTKLSSKDRVS
jgi:hypothetical protein